VQWIAVCCSVYLSTSKANERAICVLQSIAVPCGVCLCVLRANESDNAICMLHCCVAMCCSLLKCMSIYAESQ